MVFDCRVSSVLYKLIRHALTSPDLWFSIAAYQVCCINLSIMPLRRRDAKRKSVIPTLRPYICRGHQKNFLLSIFRDFMLFLYGVFFSALRSFLFLWVLRLACVILLRHPLFLPYNYFESTVYRLLPPS